MVDWMVAADTEKPFVIGGLVPDWVFGLERFGGGRGEFGGVRG